MMSGRVWHFGNYMGPDASSGIASVLSEYRRWPWNGISLSFSNTYVVGSSSGSARAWLRSLAHLLPREPGAIAHVHLSYGGSLIREGSLAVAARSRGWPVVLTVHGSRFEETLRQRPRLVSRVLRSAHGVIVLHTGAQRAVTQLVPSAHVTVIPNSVSPTERAASTTTEPVLVFAGEVGRRKGVDILLEAWESLGEPVGDLVLLGPIREPELVRPLPGVTFLGARTREEVQEWLVRARAAVLPSRAEAMPMFVLEAMGSGVPVIGTDVGGMADTIGEAGIVVPVGSAPELADAIRLLLTDEAVASSLGERAASRTADLFSRQRVQAQLEAEYSRVRSVARSASRRERK